MSVDTTIERLQRKLSIIKSAFDDRNRVIEIQVEDKKVLQQQLDQANTTIDKLCDAFEELYGIWCTAESMLEDSDYNKAMELNAIVKEVRWE